MLHETWFHHVANRFRVVGKMSMCFYTHTGPQEIHWDPTGAPKLQYLDCLFLSGSSLAKMWTVP